MKKPGIIPGFLLEWETKRYERSHRCDGGDSGRCAGLALVDEASASAPTLVAAPRDEAAPTVEAALGAGVCCLSGRTACQLGAAHVERGAVRTRQEKARPTETAGDSGLCLS